MTLLSLPAEEGCEAAACGPFAPSPRSGTGPAAPGPLELFEAASLMAEGWRGLVVAFTGGVGERCLWLRARLCSRPEGLYPSPGGGGERWHCRP